METKTLGEWKPDSPSMESLSLTFQRFDREYTKQKLESESILTAMASLEEEVTRLRAEDKKTNEVLSEKEKELTTIWREAGVHSLSELSEFLFKFD